MDWTEDYKFILTIISIVALCAVGYLIIFFASFILY